ncbi:hypothetical protein GOODEAATRI_009229 [Goodea atripinnis]|uniref:Uncharacterized protein n=1 Tax=Goodea atripinnis TaxID=208336 RepID=A0ABV0MGD7_9TELE
MQKDPRPGVKPRTFLLQGNSATNCTTAQPMENWMGKQTYLYRFILSCKTSSLFSRAYIQSVTYSSSGLTYNSFVDRGDHGPLKDCKEPRSSGCQTGPDHNPPPPCWIASMRCLC